MTSQATLRYYGMMADAQQPRESQFFGLNDPSVAGLRCFIRYHKDARVDVELAGKLRSLTHKQMAMSGLLARVSVTGEKATITALAKEANVVPSTLSRFLDKLQCWNVYAIDVTRGRNGGIRVRARAIADQLAAYAERAWTRIKKAAEKALSRTKLNVASTIPGLEDRYPQADKALLVDVVLMDATFSEAWDAAERRGALLAEQGSAHEAPAGGTSRVQSPVLSPEEWEARSIAFRDAVYAERLRLAIIDPAGESEAVHPLW